MTAESAKKDRINDKKLASGGRAVQSGEPKKNAPKKALPPAKGAGGPAPVAAAPRPEARPGPAKTAAPPPEMPVVHPPAPPHNTLHQEIQRLWAQAPQRLVFSAPRGGLRRASLTRVAQPGGAVARWQREVLTGTQAFHRWFDEAGVPAEAERLLREEFTQLTALAPGREWQLRVTKKGRVLARAGKAEGAAAGHIRHDRPKHHLLAEGVAVPALVDLGVMTPEGRVVAAKRDKYRQIDRFVQLVDDVLPSPPPPRLRVVDVGCGVSYLTFVLYHYLAMVRGIKVQMTGVDRREELLEVCAPAAKRYGYSGLHFAACDIADYHPDGPVDMVVSLHACDTATDHALALAVQWGAGWVFSVPCCQHEANGQMHSEALSLLTRYGLVKERTAALMTDAIRAGLLTACGYKTQLVEFVGFEHTPKNIMIRAKKAALPAARRAQAHNEVRRLCQAFGLKPCLQGLLEKAGALAAGPPAT